MSLKQRRRVMLLIETSNAYARGLLDGIAAWETEHQQWSIYLPEQERGSPPPDWLNRWDGDGIIARIETADIAKAIEQKGIPTVDVSAARHLPNLPWVETNDAMIAELALNHVDLMYNVVCVKGHYLGLSAASSGCGVVPKLKTVTLKDGSTLEDMNGAKAAELWSAGERNAVLTYLERDVLTTAQLAAFVRDTGFIRWISRKGRKNIARVKLTPVTEALENIPYPNTGWMSDPPDRREMIAWALETVGVNHE